MPDALGEVGAYPVEGERDPSEKLSIATGETPVQIVDESDGNEYVQMFHTHGSFADTLIANNQGIAVFREIVIVCHQAQDLSQVEKMVPPTKPVEIYNAYRGTFTNYQIVQVEVTVQKPVHVRR